MTWTFASTHSPRQPSAAVCRSHFLGLPKQIGIDSLANAMFGTRCWPRRTYCGECAGYDGWTAATACPSSTSPRRMPTDSRTTNFMTNVGGANGVILNNATDRTQSTTGRHHGRQPQSPWHRGQYHSQRNNGGSPSQLRGYTEAGFAIGPCNRCQPIWHQPLFDNLSVIKQYLYQGKEVKLIVKCRKNNQLVIEALAYIRGRSLSETFFIVDEAQKLNPSRSENNHYIGW